MGDGGERAATVTADLTSQAALSKKRRLSGKRWAHRARPLVFEFSSSRQELRRVRDSITLQDFRTLRFGAIASNLLKINFYFGDLPMCGGDAATIHVRDFSKSE